MKKILILFLVLVSAESVFAQTFNLGRFSVGESRIQVELDDFIIHSSDKKIEAHWVADSVQWIRNESNLLVPRALLSIDVALDGANVGPSSEGSIHFDYQKKNIIPVRLNQKAHARVYVDLFNPDEFIVFKGSIVLGKIVIEASLSKKARAKQLIDYSCSPFEIVINGIDDEYVSLGCKMYRLGKFGSERPRLEVTMSSTNLRFLNGAKPPYTLFLEDSSSVYLDMKDHQGTVRKMQIDAKIPEKLPRLKTAFGLGPYLYESRSGLEVQNANLAPSFMLYGKLDITETASFKAFDALLYSKSFFNNSGLYFSYDLASAFDERVLINALLGFQGLHYRFRSGDKTVFRVIYPQGFEVIYKHAFKENYHLTYGMFLSTAAETYTNAWIRYGKGTFLEFNYINWGHEKDQIKMWGLSIGIPFFAFF